MLGIFILYIFFRIWCDQKSLFSYCTL